jgi:hypothetical protein
MKNTRGKKARKNKNPKKTRRHKKNQHIKLKGQVKINRVPTSEMEFFLLNL